MGLIVPMSIRLPRVQRVFLQLKGKRNVLPRVDLTYPKKAIGTNTIAAMQSGIFFGYVGLIEGVVSKLKQEIDGDARVIATGGYARLLAEQTKIIEIVDRDITLVGLRYIYEMNRT